MSLAFTIIKIGDRSIRSPVYGIGKSREGVDYIVIQADSIRTHVGKLWHLETLLVSFDGPPGSASFGKPYEVDGIEYVRVYNGPPPKSLSKLREAMTLAKDQHRVAKQAYEDALARLNLAHKDCSAAGIFQNEKYREMILAERAWSEVVPDNTYDASKCSTYIDGRKV